MVSLRRRGYQGESIVSRRYHARGFEILACNFTIPGGEIDLIVTDQERCVFVEVKVVNTLDDLHDHLTPHKQQTLSKTITTYLQDHPVDKEIQVDLVYLKHDQIVEYYPNIILSTSYL